MLTPGDTHGRAPPTVGVAPPDERTLRFERIFDKCYQPVVAYARRRIDAVSSDDIVSETFMVAWRRLDDVPTEAPLPWLYAVARKTLANQRRGRVRRERLASRLALVRAIDSVDDPSSDDGSVLLALADLSPADQEVLKLAAWEQLTAAEIGTVLGCSTNAAALRLSRARKKFQQAMTVRTSSRTQEGWRSSDG